MKFLQATSFFLLLLISTTLCFPILPFFPDPLTTPVDTTPVDTTPIVVKDPQRILEPIIIVPGLFSSALEIQLINDIPPNLFCAKHSTEYVPFYPPTKEELEVEPLFDCFINHLQLSYDNDLNVFSNTSGTNVLPIGFGLANATAYIQNFTNRFFAVGYTNVNIRGAPYDWRTDGYAANISYQYLQLINLVEETYAANNNSKVHLIGHSFGSPYIYYFLAKIAPQDWKDQYIASYISLSGPFLGATVASVLLAAGEALFPAKIPNPQKTLALNTYRDFPSLVGLMPPEKFWETVVISTPSRNYTAQDNLELLVDANLTRPLYMRINNFEDYNTLPPPGTLMHCMYGYGIPTANTFVFQDDYFQHLADVEKVSGDSSITVESLNYCSTWSSQQTQPINVLTYFNVSHNGMIDNNAVFNYIVNVTSHFAS